MRLLVALSMCLLVGRTWSVEVTLGAVTATITEGEDMVIRCSVSAPVEDRPIITKLSYSMMETTAEDNYDAPLIENYLCVIPTNTLSSSVRIKTWKDRVIEDEEMYVITGTPRIDTDTVIETATFNLQDDGEGGPVTIRATASTFNGVEGQPIWIRVECIDDRGNIVPFEKDYILGFTFADDTALGASTGGGSDEDYNNVVSGMMPNIRGSTKGVAKLFENVGIETFDDSIEENAERFKFKLSDMAQEANIRVDEMHEMTVTINDDDKLEMFVINPNANAPRKSKGVFRQVIITNKRSTRIEWSVHPASFRRELARDVRIRPLRHGMHGIDFRLPYNRKTAKYRFAEFTFTTRDMESGKEISVVSTISAESRRSKDPLKAVHATMTAYPASGNPGELRLQETVNVSLSGGDRKQISRLQWTQIMEDNSERKMPDNYGKSYFEVTSPADVGLYVVCPKNRCKKGWVIYVRVFMSECPKGWYHDAGWCDGGPIEGMHGGVVDPRYSAGICSCPPGFIGPRCQYPMDRSHFGSVGASTQDLFGNDGRGLSFSLPTPFGSTCASGSMGAGCKEKCRFNRFGAGCAFTCHCDRGRCSETGVCTRGCARGSLGDTCQE